MKIFFIVLGCFIALVIAFVVYRYFATINGQQKSMQALFDKIEPVIADLKAGRTPAVEKIEALAASADTRNILFSELRALQREDLFPQKYRSIEAIGESDLVIWLLHPNELGTKPDEIEAMKQIEREEGGDKYRFVVYRFRTREPHWTAKDGWLAGIAGPYWEGKTPNGLPGGVFSKFEPYDSKSADQHFEEIEKLLLGK